MRTSPSGGEIDVGSIHPTEFDPHSLIAGRSMKVDSPRVAQAQVIKTGFDFERADPSHGLTGSPVQMLSRDQGPCGIERYTLEAERIEAIRFVDDNCHDISGSGFEQLALLDELLVLIPDRGRMGRQIENHLLRPRGSIEQKQRGLVVPIERRTRLHEVILNWQNKDPIRTGQSDEGIVVFMSEVTVDSLLPGLPGGFGEHHHRFRGGRSLEVQTVSHGQDIVGIQGGADADIDRLLNGRGRGLDRL